MTQEWILRTLIELGFKREEAEVYLLLYKDGPKKAKDITEILKICKSKVYRILKRLQENKMIQATSANTTYFEVIQLDNFLDLLVKNCLNEANLLEERKLELFAKSKSITGKIEFSIDEGKKDKKIL